MRTSAWRIFLADQPRFWSLLNDLAYMFPVLVPIKAENNVRRIVKLSYETQVVIPRLRSSVLITKWVPKRATHFYAAAKDAFEGILPYAGSDWETRGFHTQPSGRGETVGFRLVEKASQALGWAPKTMHFAALSVGHGGSYHFEYEVPRGLQIRQATLTVHEPRAPGSTERNGGTVRRMSVMGAQTLQRAHLYATDLPQNSAGVAAIRMKVAPTTLVRGAWFAALLSTALLFVGFVKIDTLTSPAGGNLGPSLALFLLLPGLIAGLLTRGDEHPMTTNMLFGLRCLCAFIASLPTSAVFSSSDFDHRDGSLIYGNFTQRERVVVPGAPHHLGGSPRGD